MLARHIPDPPTLIGPIGVLTARSLPMLAMRAACGFPSVGAHLKLTQAAR